MRIKDESVNIWGLQPPMRIVLKYADRIWSDYNKELVITSARDGIHSAGSWHYYGYAVDFRIWGFSDYQLKDVVKELGLVLGKDYDVVLESDHIHVEYDPKLEAA